MAASVKSPMELLASSARKKSSNINEDAIRELRDEKRELSPQKLG